MKNAFPWIVMAIYCGLLVANGATHGISEPSRTIASIATGADSAQLPDFLRPFGKFAQ